MKKLDFAVIALVAVLSLLPLAGALFGRAADGGATVTVTQRGTVLYTGPLSADATVATPDGGNTVEIRDGQARMLAADCPDGLCMQGGAATAQHPLVCLPNGVTVTVTGGEEAGLDAVTQ